MFMGHMGLEVTQTDICATYIFIFVACANQVTKVADIIDIPFVLCILNCAESSFIVSLACFQAPDPPRHGNKGVTVVI